jgi:hypothetical protein
VVVLVGKTGCWPRPVFCIKKNFLFRPKCEKSLAKLTPA